MTAIRWTPGMRESTAGAICVRAAADGAPWLWAIDDSIVPDEDGAEDCEPDMTHAGTRGEILEQAREAWGPAATFYEQTGGRVGGSLVVSEAGARGVVLFKAMGGTAGERVRRCLEAAP